MQPIFRSALGVALGRIPLSSSTLHCLYSTGPAATQTADHNDGAPKDLSDKPSRPGASELPRQLKRKAKTPRSSSSGATVLPLLREYGMADDIPRPAPGTANLSYTSPECRLSRQERRIAAWKKDGYAWQWTGHFMEYLPLNRPAAKAHSTKKRSLGRVGE